MTKVGKPTERLDSDFVEPVLLLPACRAVPHSHLVALRSFCFWNRRQCFADAIERLSFYRDVYAS